MEDELIDMASPIVSRERASKNNLKRHFIEHKEAQGYTVEIVGKDAQLIDLDHAVIVDVEASRAIRQAEVGAARTMTARTQDRFGLWPARLAAESAYGSAEHLAWLVHERGIEPYIPVFDKSERRDGTFSRSAFSYDPAADADTCPAGHPLRPRQKVYRTPFPLIDGDGVMRNRASKRDCEPAR